MSSDLLGNPQQRRAVLWAQGGAIRNLGTLPGGASSRALGISKGEVVGTSETSDGEHAFLWTDAGGMQDLNSLLTSRSGFILTQAVSINSQGIILAIGQNDDSAKATRSLSGSSCLSQHLKANLCGFQQVTRLAG